MGILDKLLGRTWQKYQARGNKFYKSEEFGLALHEYKEAIKRFSGDDFTIKKGMEESLADCRSALRGMQLKKAERFHKAAQFDRAKDCCEAALRHALNEAEEKEVHDYMADLDKEAEVAAQEKEEAAQALSEVDKLLGMSGEDERFFILLGPLPDAQQEHYEKLGASFRGGFLAMHDGEFDAALSLFRTAYKEHNEDPFVMAELARALLIKGEKSESVRLLAAAEKAKPASIYIKLRYTEALWLSENHAEAERVLQEAHDLEPDNDQIYMAIAEHALRTGEYESGVDAVGVLLDRRPNDVSLLRLKGQLHHQGKQFDQAIECYEAALLARWERNKETGVLEFDHQSALGAASIYIERKQKIERAITLLGAMLSVSEGADKIQMQIGLAEAYKIKGKPQKSREYLEQALRVLPDQAAGARAEILKRMKELGV